jgi:hypothetical protein
MTAVEAPAPAGQRAIAPADHTCHIVCCTFPELPLCGSEPLDADHGWCPDDCPNTCIVCDDLHDGICLAHGVCTVCKQQCWMPL